MNYQIFYSPDSVKDIGRLDKRQKDLIRKVILKVSQFPLIGKPLRDEFSGFYSQRTSRFRIIYTINNEKQRIDIHRIGLRKEGSKKDIYKLFEKYIRVVR